MNIRRITSLTSLLSFTFLIITAIILYIVPQGRVAYWANWHLWGLTKTAWTNIHINLGLLFLLSILLHIYYNWKTILAYLKNKAKELKVFNREFNFALVLTAVFLFGTYFEVVPFRWVLDLNEYAKEVGSQKYGEPPYGHAEMSSLKSFTSKMGMNLADSLARLQKANINFENEKETIKEIAKANNLTPKQVYLAMKPAEENSGQGKKMPKTAPAGLGKRVLEEVCRTYNLDLDAVVKFLAEQNIKAGGKMKLKEIAAQNNQSPHDVYDNIYKFAEGK